jgi:hypothetical protein
MASLNDLYHIVNQAIDLAFVSENYNLNFYEYLSGEKVKKEDVNAFINSSVGISINHQIEELELYLLGGSSSTDLKEAYSWMGKPRVRKVKDYLNNILKDAERYERTKRRGRKPKTSNK